MKNGHPEYVTKSWHDGGRQYRGYIAMVSVPGDDTYEVGLSPLRKLLGLTRFSPAQTSILSNNRPERISFTGKCHTSSYGAYNDLVITEESAQEWASLVIGHIHTSELL